MARVRAGNPPRLVPDGINKLQQSGLLTTEAGAAPTPGAPQAPQAPQAPSGAGGQGVPQVASQGAPQAPATTPGVPPTGAAPSGQQAPLWKGLSPDVRQKAAQAAEQAVVAMPIEGGADRPAPEDPVRKDRKSHV